MRFLLILRVSSAGQSRLSEEQRSRILAGHREFERLASEAGELLCTQALADPSTSTVIRDGSIAASRCGVDEFMGGYYLVDVESKQRAIELAELLPDARLDGHAVEVRPVMFTAAADF
jgi:hypothetical protein